MEDNKIKLLFYGDSPTGNTGFATVSKNILKRLHATGKYDITVMGINYYGDPHDLPYKIYPAAVNTQGDVYGRQRLLDVLRVDKNHFDILFTLQDTFIMATIGEALKKLKNGAIVEKDIYNKETEKVERKKVFQKGKGFKWIYYYPIDAKPEKEWLDKSVAFCDVAVPYTEFAKKESLALLDRSYEVIYHGADLNTFYPMNDEEKEKFRDKFFGKSNLKNKFLIVNVNRNQPRKGLLQTFLAFKMFNTLIPNSVLYTHCNIHDHAGFNILKQAEKMGIKDNWIYPNPEKYRLGIEFPDSFINGVYNIADVNISTTLGEGFGLSMVEAMACKKINVFPDNTSISEILENNRGLLTKCGNTPNNLISFGPMDNDLIRPVVDIEDMIKNLIWVYSHREEVRKIQENAYIWAIDNLNWDNIATQWDRLIERILNRQTVSN